MTNQSISQLAPDAGAAVIFLVVRFAASIPKRSRQVVAMQETDSRGASTSHPYSFVRLRPGNPVVKALATRIDWEQGAQHEKGDLLSVSQGFCRSAADWASLTDAPKVRRVPGTPYLTAWANPGKSKERTGIAAHGHPAGTPGAGGVECLWARENGQRLGGGERGRTD
jgi:hypothetical protein